LLVCSEHQNDYPWCPCGDESISDEIKFPSYGCDTCHRYYHQSCSGLSGSDIYFKCDGCKTNDFYRKELKLHELLLEISNIEKSSKWNDHTYRFLNAFPFKYSELLENKIG
jgi:hypothetical protein